MAATRQLEVPADHQVGMRVPAGGSNCSKCEYLSDDKLNCHNHFFQRANHDQARLPAPANRYCCDFFEADSAVERG
jgi:hypothetical protein